MNLFGMFETCEARAGHHQKWWALASKVLLQFQDLKQYCLVSTPTGTKIYKRMSGFEATCFCSAADVGLVICVLIWFSVENGWFTTHLPQIVSEKHVQFHQLSTSRWIPGSCTVLAMAARSRSPNGRSASGKKILITGSRLSGRMQRRFHDGMWKMKRPSWCTNQNYYPLVISHSYGKSQFLMGKLTINGHFQ